MQISLIIQEKSSFQISMKVETARRSFVPAQFACSRYLRNKAGYTANTSRGRVGRGRNACFPTFQLDHHGPTNQPTDQRTAKASYSVASPRLKMNSRLRSDYRFLDVD